jgi:Na+/melibiose symporter-like transporter
VGPPETVSAVRLASLLILMQKVASSVALLALDRSGYVPNLAQQGPRALLAIRVLVGVVPAGLWSVAIAFAALYPLGRQRHLEIRQELAKRRLAADR